MLTPASGVRVYIATGSTDMRKAINGLSILVESRMKLEAFSGQIFVFSNRRRNMIKLLYWEHNGFCLWQKRLERERFRWPESAEEVVRVSSRQLRWLLDGLELVQGRAHRQVQYRSVT
ncbi:MAG: IS66 family insertion sequence element accessory protein TnpB [Nitrospirae bacterium]|nr:IS66 family insertion sequence element accessory protein TnpB [Nitrospirota bacterium]